MKQTLTFILTHRSFYLKSTKNALYVVVVNFENALFLFHHFAIFKKKMSDL